MSASDADIADSIRRADDLLRQHAAGPSALDEVLAKQRKAAGDIPPLSPSVERTQRGWAGMETGKLPEGISGGKVAAIVAGIGLLGGAVYLMTRPKRETPDSWRGRVQAQRSAMTGADLSH